MECVIVNKYDIYWAIAEANGFSSRQKVTGWGYEGDDDIIFYTNRKNRAAVRFDLLEFVFFAGQKVDSDIRKHKCNQLEVKGDDFIFYYDEGATELWENDDGESGSIPENRGTTEKAYIELNYYVSALDIDDYEAHGFQEPQEVAFRRDNIKKRKPYFELQVLHKVDEEDVPFYRRGGKGSVYWVIPDEQMKRIEYTMWHHNQFAKVFDFGRITKTVCGHTYDKGIEAYMDGKLFTKDGKPIMLASDKNPMSFTDSPAFRHTGSPSAEDTHAIDITCSDAV